MSCPTGRKEPEVLFPPGRQHIFCWFVHVLIVSVNKCLSTSIQFLTVDVVLFVFLAMLSLWLSIRALNNRVTDKEVNWIELKNHIIIIIIIIFAEFVVGQLSVETAHNT